MKVVESFGSGKIIWQGRGWYIWKEYQDTGEYFWQKEIEASKRHQAIREGQSVKFFDDTDVKPG